MEEEQDVEMEEDVGEEEDVGIGDEDVYRGGGDGGGDDGGDGGGGGGGPGGASGSGGASGPVPDLDVREIMVPRKRQSLIAPVEQRVQIGLPSQH